MNVPLGARILWKQRYRQAFVLLGLAFIFIFRYAPLFGLVMAFKNYKISSGIGGIFSSQWVGLKHFAAFLNDPNFVLILRNTFLISIFKLLFSFPIPIVFAIMLNEVRWLPFKRLTQTVSYLPHFVSWVVVAGIAHSFLSGQSGLVNVFLTRLGIVKAPIQFLTAPSLFYTLAVSTDIWKEFGWWAIIFIAAISGIDPALYESAQIDGASRLQRVRHITLPGIRGVIAIVLILSLGNLLGGGVSGSNFEQSLLLGNGLNMDRAQIVQSYVLKVGLTEARYSYATAVGLLEALLSVVLVFGSNWASRRLSGVGLF